jgi:hypothetical protein
MTIMSKGYTVSFFNHAPPYIAEVKISGVTLPFPCIPLRRAQRKFYMSTCFNKKCVKQDSSILYGNAQILSLSVVFRRDTFWSHDLQTFWIRTARGLVDIF